MYASVASPAKEKATSESLSLGNPAPPPPANSRFTGRNNVEPLTAASSRTLLPCRARGHGRGDWGVPWSCTTRDGNMTAMR